MAAHTFSGQSLGTADGSRIIAVAVGVGFNAPQDGTLNSVTVGGTSLTKQVGAVAAPNSDENFRAEIWSGSVPSGTTADIVVTLSEAIGTI